MKFNFDIFKDSPEDLLKAAVSDDYLTYEKAFKLLDEECALQAKQFIEHVKYTGNVYFQEVSSKSKNKRYFKLYAVTSEYKLQMFRPSIYKFIERSNSKNINVINKIFYSVNNANKTPYLCEEYMCQKLGFDRIKNCSVLKNRHSLIKDEVYHILFTSKVRTYLTGLAEMSGEDPEEFRKLKIYITIIS